MNENPWAYNEARNRLREEKERERKVFENLVDRFEKEKTHMRAEKKFDIFDFISSLFFKFIIKPEVFVTFEKSEKPDILFLKLKNIYIEGNNDVRYF